ncbi:MAG TPA: hypothetical protein VLE48_12790 [Terriglobales bacterium]|nr:hypothetical protein [Terriglobales bacterium]
MKRAILPLFLMISLAAFGQGKSGSAGRPAGAGAPSQSMGHGPEMGRPADAGKPAVTGQPESTPSANSSQAHEQRALTSAQINGGSFKMLQEKTGMSSEQLQQLYASSGAKNYGQFVSAVMVSKNLNLDTNAVLEGMKTKSLGKTLKDMGVSDQAASAEIKKANKEIKAADKKKSS